MSPYRVAVVGVALIASACKIEQTPREYFDHTDPIVVEREEAADEIRDRLLALGQAVTRGDAVDALQALSPAPGAYAVGPLEGMELEGAGQIDSVLGYLAGAGVAVGMRDVRVEVGPRANVAWFTALVDVPGSAELAAATLRATGVYVREEGEWRLVQAQLSLPAPLTALRPSPESASDSAAGGSSPGS